MQIWCYSCGPWGKERPLGWARHVDPHECILPCYRLFLLFSVFWGKYAFLSGFWGKGPAKPSKPQSSPWPHIPQKYHFFVIFFFLPKSDFLWIFFRGVGPQQTHDQLEHPPLHPLLRGFGGNHMLQRSSLKESWERPRAGGEKIGLGKVLTEVVVGSHHLLVHCWRTKGRGMDKDTVSPDMTGSCGRWCVVVRSHCGQERHDRLGQPGNVALYIKGSTGSIGLANWGCQQLG